MPFTLFIDQYSLENYWLLPIMATKLVMLPETQRLSSRVIRVLGGNPGKVRGSKG